MRLVRPAEVERFNSLPREHHCLGFRRMAGRRLRNVDESRGRPAGGGPRPLDRPSTPDGYVPFHTEHPLLPAAPGGRDPAAGLARPEPAPAGQRLAKGPPPRRVAHRVVRRRSHLQRGLQTASGALDWRQVPRSP